MRPLVASTLLAVFALPAAADHTRPARTVAQTAAGSGQFRTLVNLLVAADLLDPLGGKGPFVVFAPTDAAFNKLPAGTVEALLKPGNKPKLVALLGLHVVPGRRAVEAFDGTAASLAGPPLSLTGGNIAVSVNGVKVADPAGVACSNGTVYVVEAVLSPRAAGGDRIPAVAEKAGTFTTLLAALTAADLAEVLAEDGPFTVFAPTDEAFKKLPEGTVADLLKPANKSRLVRLLKYHVLAGRVSAKEAVAAETAPTLGGGTVRVRIVDGRLRVNGSDVVKTDVPSGNGVIHVLDRVLTPPKGH